MTPKPGQNFVTWSPWSEQMLGFEDAFAAHKHASEQLEPVFLLEVLAGYNVEGARTLAESGFDPDMPSKDELHRRIRERFGPLRIPASQSQSKKEKL